MNFSKFDLKKLACFVHDVLKKNDIDVVLVGGACVSIYSKNRYESYDLDFVTYEELAKVEKVLQKFDFKRKGRCFSHKNCPYIIDFVNPPIAIGQECIYLFKTLKTSVGSLHLLTPTDCVKDRLSSFFHWGDEAALEQAILVAQTHTVDINNIKHWAEAEGHLKKLKKFLEKL